MARTADFLAAAADRHLAHWRQLAGSMGLRQCRPYLESQASQLARIQVRGTVPADVDAAGPAGGRHGDERRFRGKFHLEQAIRQAQEQSPAREVLLCAVEAPGAGRASSPDDYSLCVLPRPASVEEPDKKRRRTGGPGGEGSGVSSTRRPAGRSKRRRRSSMPWASSSSPRRTGLRTEKSDCGDRHHTLSSKLLKDGQVYATYLYEWIRTLGQERLLADLLEQNDPRLAPYMRKADAGED